ncbi:MAG: hypothetical protein KDB02_01160 [Acidimicrobiales bacterium]|nr:hypothetical protein [Acidimicrobiales bacterium]
MRSRSHRAARPWTIAVLVTVIALALGAASCSSDDSGGSTADKQELTPADQTTTVTGPPSSTAVPVEPGTAEQYTKALLSSLTSDPDNTGLMNATEAACVAPKWVDSITPERFGKAGIAPEDLKTQKSMSVVNKVGLSVKEAKALVEKMKGCGIDVRERWLATTNTRGQVVDTKVRSCLEKKLTTDLVDTMAAVGLSGNTSDPTARQSSGEFLAVLQECGVYPAGQ